jgi:hypothetical protein
MKWWMWALLGLGALYIFNELSRPQTFEPNGRPVIPAGGTGISATLRFGNGWVSSATLGNSSPISTGNPGGDLTTGLVGIADGRTSGVSRDGA